MTEGNRELITALVPVLDTLQGLDLSKPKEALATLNKTLPLYDKPMVDIQMMCFRGLKAGWLCNREAGAAKFSRVAKASEATRNFSIDAVLSHGAGMAHTHPKGEVNLCILDYGEPRFDGHEEGWAVYAPGTTHKPDVEGGRMLLLYFLPDGQIEWHR